MDRLDNTSHFKEGNRQLHYAIKDDANLLQIWRRGTLVYRSGWNRQVGEPLGEEHFQEQLGITTVELGDYYNLLTQMTHRSRHLDYHPKGVGGRNTWGGGTKCR